MNQNVLARYRGGRADQLENLKRLLRIPSISTEREDAEMRKSVRAAADFVANELKYIGLENVTVREGQELENPLVTAEWLHAPGKPTVLLYAHYDVQPADPTTENWDSPPFEPTERNGKLFARGAADDKGQLWILVEAIRGWMLAEHKLPVNIKILFEGDEESEGVHVSRFVSSAENAKFFEGVTSVVVLDSGMFKPGLPTITTGLRGIACFELSVTGCKSDQHSGEKGGVAPNAAHGLAKIISAFTTPTGRIAIPGIYDLVQPPHPLEVQKWKALPFSEAEHLRDLGVVHAIGDRRYSQLHRMAALPTFDVNGMTSGYTGKGFKTVIPSVAKAKFSIRLVPGMDPAVVTEMVRKHIAKVAPRWITSWNLEELGSTPAVVVDPMAAPVQAAAQAMSETFFNESVAYVREGGSIPVVTDFINALKVPVLVTGFTHPDCSLHAPNENLDIESFYLGIEAIGRYFEILGE
jgi:acetylornithine deacetylase/succinyl-diaminopimelate desuccinylase-like protein